MHDSTQDHGDPSLGRKKNQSRIKNDGEDEIFLDHPEDLTGESNRRWNLLKFIGSPLR